MTKQQQHGKIYPWPLSSHSTHTHTHTPLCKKPMATDLNVKAKPLKSL